ncbi:hypothetical protein [Aurantiacibacter spongiae]|uniref:Uncharacterized protein n=1 Tax=Aurantiacibacter spongiae TaxID=2488860 RepID=A0A3N5DHY1_9SPHN|nr:hypothetical protein [Aurantiacibacter spongiae]RPF70215.1 hypothetical protein EG799_00160 [Aurantiacibacter spongiae]
MSDIDTTPITDSARTPPMTATDETVKPTRRAYGDRNLVGDATREARAMASEGMAHPSTKPVLKGAAIGAVAGAILPFVTLPLGLAAGAGYAFYKRVRPD